MRTACLVVVAGLASVLVAVPLSVAVADESPVATAFAAARRASLAQVSQLNVTPVVPAEGPVYAAPSAAVRALAARYGVVPDASQEAALAGLDRLAEPGRSALTALVGAFVSFDDAVRSTSAPANVGAVLGARANLLDAVEALYDAVPVGAVMAPVGLCPAAVIDVSGTSDTYTDNCALIVDVGGNDYYYNNAGGSNVLSTSCNVTQGVAAALVDLAGADSYVSGRDCGVNGGGEFGGAGFLADLDGDDVYTAGQSGTNGGGAWAGTGLLFDAFGYDSYSAAYDGTNGGGSSGGAGLLVDAAGVDRYSAGSSGVNGGANLGTGLLYDAGGSGDLYSEFDHGTRTDETLFPKGLVGAQVDSNSSGSQTPPTLVERTLASQSVPLSTPPVAGQNIDLLRVDGRPSTTRPGNYDINLWVNGQPSPTNPISVFTGGLVTVPITASLVSTPPVAGHTARIDVTVKYRYDPTQTVCLLGVGSTCVNSPINPLNVSWLTSSGSQAALVAQAALVLDGQQVAGQTVSVPLAGQILGTLP